jgi:hypothetical protein
VLSMSQEGTSKVNITARILHKGLTLKVHLLASLPAGCDRAAAEGQGVPGQGDAEGSNQGEQPTNSWQLL